MSELEKYADPEPLQVLIDLEVSYRYPLLYARNLHNYFKNRRLIEQILSLENVRCVSAEDPWAVGALGVFARILGVSYPKLMHGNRGIMFYSSLLNRSIFRYLNNRKRFCKALAKDLARDPNISVAVGTIAVGARGNEPILTPAELEKDLSALQELGVKEVTVFRLGGLTAEYVRVLERFADI